MLEYLFEIFADRSRTTVKSMLAHRQVRINGECVTAFDHALHVGDKLCISSVGEQRENSRAKCRIVYEDDDLIVINKREGVLSVPTQTSKEMTAYNMMMSHVRHYGSNRRVFVLHRLDRSTSGLMMFAKNEEVQHRMRDDWNHFIQERCYVAVVEGSVERDKGRIVSWLTEDARTLCMFSSNIDNGGQKAITNYRVLRRGECYSLVELELETGRKNQIRVQLAAMGHPVAGDKRYGAQTNPLQRVCLHACSLAFFHPVTGELMTFRTDIPKAFLG